MGTVKSLTHVKRIVESEEEPVIVVVSALGGITDMLIATARMASKGDTSYLQNYAKIIERHNDVINGMVPKDKLLDVHSVVDPLLEELGNIYRGVALIKDLSSRSLDIIVSYGERLSSAIISRIIDSAQYFDSRNFINMWWIFRLRRVLFAVCLTVFPEKWQLCLALYLLIKKMAI